MQELGRDYYSCNLSPSSAMEIDIMMADSISRQLIVDILAAFRKWTEICITTSIFAVSINGALHGYFHGAKGKSRVYFDDIADHDKAALCGLPGFQGGPLPVRYLGVPLIFTKLPASESLLHQNSHFSLIR
ncbi:hypothetical protein Acr_19g0004110 [Actinidia rufa]|uniref:Uncharacterized protein n=1 Tax=Actinidia rufa TaxID=165716 RepID=A0A7J0G9J7_9ERIC|nr:hypothetical protein Acr_19g0004110 [Actinidia rufa]